MKNLLLAISLIISSSSVFARVSQECAEKLVSTAKLLEDSILPSIDKTNKSFDITYSVQRDDTRSWYRQTFELTDLKLGKELNLALDKSNEVPMTYDVIKNSKGKNAILVNQYDNYGAMAFHLYPSVQKVCGDYLEVVAVPDEYINPKAKIKGTDEITVSDVRMNFYNLIEKNQELGQVSIGVNDQRRENQKDIQTPSQNYAASNSALVENV